MRKAGQLLQQLLGKAGDLDRAYAYKVRDAIPEDKTLLRMIGGAAFKDMQIPKDLPREFVKEAYLSASGVAAANAGIRYGLPAAGLALAHKGFEDIYNTVADVPIFPAGDQQSENTLMM